MYLCLQYFKLYILINTFHYKYVEKRGGENKRKKKTALMQDTSVTLPMRNKRILSLCLKLL